MSTNAVIDLNLSPSISKILDNNDDLGSWDEWGLGISRALNADKVHDTIFPANLSHSPTSCSNPSGTANSTPSHFPLSCYEYFDTFEHCLDMHPDINHHKDNLRSMEQNIEPRIERLKCLAEGIMAPSNDVSEQELPDREVKKISSTLKSISPPSSQRSFSPSPSRHVSSPGSSSPESGRQDLIEMTLDKKLPQQQPRSKDSTKDRRNSLSASDGWTLDPCPMEESKSQSRAAVDTERFHDNVKRYLGFSDHEQDFNEELSDYYYKQRMDQQSGSQNGTPVKRHRQISDIDSLLGYSNRSSRNIKDQDRSTESRHSTPARSNPQISHRESFGDYSSYATTATTENETGRNGELLSYPHRLHYPHLNPSFGWSKNHFQRLQSSFVPSSNQYNQPYIPSYLYPNYSNESKKVFDRSVQCETGSMSPINNRERQQYEDISKLDHNNDLPNHILIQFAASEIDMLSQLNYWERRQHSITQQFLRDTLESRNKLHLQLKSSKSRIKKLEKSHHRLHRRYSRERVRSSKL